MNLVLTLWRALKEVKQCRLVGWWVVGGEGVCEGRQLSLGRKKEPKECDTDAGLKKQKKKKRRPWRGKRGQQGLGLGIDSGGVCVCVSVCVFFDGQNSSVHYNSAPYCTHFAVCVCGDSFMKLFLFLFLVRASGGVVRELYGMFIYALTVFVLFRGDFIIFANLSVAPNRTVSFPFVLCFKWKNFVTLL